MKITNHIDKLQLEQYISNSLSDTDYQSLHEHIHQCSHCKEHIEQLKMEQQLFLQEFPFDTIEEKISVSTNNDMKKENNTIPFPAKRYSAIAALFICAFVSIFIIQFEQTNENLQPDFRTKGTYSFDLLVKGEHGEIQQRTNHIYLPGEQIQPIYTNVKKRYFGLYSMDSSGTVFSYSLSKKTLDKIKIGPNIPYDNSITLDDYIGDELFIAVFSDQPKEHSEIISLIKSKYKNSQNLAEIIFDSQNNDIFYTILIRKRNAR